MKAHMQCISLTEEYDTETVQKCSALSLSVSDPEDVPSSCGVARGHAVYLVPYFLGVSECEQFKSFASNHVDRVPPTPDSSGDGEPRMHTISV